MGLVFISSCRHDSWSDQEKDDFVDTCIDEGGTKKYCKCFLKKNMEKYPRYEDSNEISFEEAVELSKECK